MDPYNLCRHCLDTLPRNLTPCRQCGLPLHGGEASLCGRCLKRPPPFERAIIPLHYQPPLDSVILALKYHQGLAHARLFGELLADAVVLGDSRPELIIPVPLHSQRLRQRGYNQALEIAKPLASRLSLPIACHQVQRNRPTESQTTLSYKERHRNLRGAFTVMAPLPRHVAIVDDVVTSGSTVTNLAKVLRKSGVTEIDLWAVARASLRAKR